MSPVSKAALSKRAGERPLSGWHPADVKAAIQKRGQTLAGLARQNGFNEAYLRNTLMRPLFQGEQIIAHFLGVEASAIWPDRYDADGQPSYRTWRARHRNQRFTARRARAA